MEDVVKTEEYFYGKINIVLENIDLHSHNYPFPVLYFNGINLKKKHTPKYQTCMCNKLLLILFITAVTLDKNGASVTWDAKNSSELSVPSDRLHLRQILLGHTAKVDEYNVIEVSKHFQFKNKKSNC